MHLHHAVVRLHVGEPNQPHTNDLIGCPALLGCDVCQTVDCALCLDRHLHIPFLVVPYVPFAHGRTSVEDSASMGGVDP